MLRVRLRRVRGWKGGRDRTVDGAGNLEEGYKKGEGEGYVPCGGTL